MNVEEGKGDPGAEEPYPLLQGADRGAHQGSPASEKVLQEAGMFPCVATRVLGVLQGFCAEALIEGTTDPEVLAELARGRLHNRVRRHSFPDYLSPAEYEQAILEEAAVA